MKNFQFLALFLLTFGLVATSCDDDEGIIDNVRDVDAYVSSNTTNALTVIDFADLDNITERKLTVPYSDADGIAFNDIGDRIFQASRSDNKIYSFEDVDDAEDGATLTVEASSFNDVSNLRGMAIKGDRIAVVQDGNDENGQQNRIFIYERDGNEIREKKAYNIDFNLWGIAWEDNDLYAIVDNSNMLAVFENFGGEESGDTAPGEMYEIEGLTRTHGIVINDREGIMILTDIGDASSDSDGALHIIDDFKDRLEGARENNNNVLAQNQQIRIAGDNTQLGNPVDVEYNPNSNRVFVAERANGGGKVLVFDTPEGSGNVAPIQSRNVPGASSIALDYGL